ncbi:MAG: cysteine--tRNA ligase, partial [Desulfurococcaceae archaeon]|nr:cysteine--tRNA ligase [Desulfurococcaceae archaeon]
SDFNTPEALAVISELISLIYKEMQYNPKYMLISLSLKLFRLFNSVFGVFEEYPERALEIEPLTEELMKIIIETRRELRKRGLYDLSDRLREELSRIGIQLMDKGLETTWIIKRKQQP